MKLAICISGPLRTLDVNNLFNTFGEADYFVHTNIYDKRLKELKPKLYTVEDIDFNEHPYYWVNINADYKEFLASSDRVHPIVTKEEFKKKFLSWKFEIERPGKWSSKPYNVLSMFYGIMQCNFLKKCYEQSNNFKYDCVVRIRPDAIIKNPIDCTSFDLDNLNTFNTPINLKDIYINDHFAASSSHNMDLYSQAFINIPKYYYMDEVDFIPEILMRHHVNKSNLKITEHIVPYVVTRDDERNDVYMNM